jgi:hypothetical protein
MYEAPRAAVGASSRRGVVRMFLALVGLCGPVSRAEAQFAVAMDTAPHALRVDGTRLVPGRLVYDLTLERDASSTPLGTRTISAQPATYAGGPAWLLTEERYGSGVPATDSLFADIATLRPIHWSSTLGVARLSIAFRGDTAYGGTSGPPGKRSFVSAFPSGTIVNAAMLSAVLRLLPLQTGWEDSTATLSVSLSRATALPTLISVIGDDRVRVPAGEFDCWVVSVHSGDAGRGLYWVTKRDPIIVRSAVDVPRLGGATLVSALTRIAQ